MKICFDSTILIEIARKRQESIDLTKNLMENSHEIIISAVTVSEILAGVHRRENHEKAEQEAKTVLSQFDWISLNGEIAKKTGKLMAYLYQNGMIIEYQDVAIAATAIETNSDYLITLNKKHFERLPELKGKVFTPPEFTKKIRL